MHRVRRPTALAAALLLAACTADGSATEEEPPPLGGEERDDADPEDTGPGASDNEEPGASRDEEDDPFAVPDDPDEIDEAYAERVINALLEIDTEALIIALDQEPGEVLSVEAAEKLAAISVGERRATAMDDFQTYINEPATQEGLLPAEEMFPTTAEVDEVLHVEPERCLLLIGWWDISGNATNPRPPEEKSVFSLSRIDRDVTSRERNPTPWAIRAIRGLEDTEGQRIPEDRWDDIQFRDNLDRTCENR